VSTYLSVTATLQTAQARLDEHPLGLDGSCRRCGVDGQTCVERRSALAVFAEYRRLPRRLPGASRAGLRPISASGFGTGQGGRRATPACAQR
jgi:hypothetical protein